MEWIFYTVVLLIVFGIAWQILQILFGLILWLIVAVIAGVIVVVRFIITKLKGGY